MSIADLREMTHGELVEALAEAKDEKFNLRFQLATNQLDNTARIKEVKKEIARILTVLGERGDDAAPSVSDDEPLEESA